MGQQKGKLEKSNKLKIISLKIDKPVFASVAHILKIDKPVFHHKHIKY